jgi:arsenate reductase-like glutaredoxin family protein
MEDGGRYLKDMKDKMRKVLQKEKQRNRYDGKKPFDVIRAEDFGGDLYEFYEPLEQIMRNATGVDISGSRPVFLIGGRGSGKTMVLKFLSFQAQISEFINDLARKDKSTELSQSEMEDFLKSKTFLGVYLHFKSIEYDQFKGKMEKFFVPYLSIRVAEQVFKMLGALKCAKVISLKEESEIVEFFIEQIKEPKTTFDRNFESVLYFIQKRILPDYELLLEKNPSSSLAEIRNEGYCIPVVVSKGLIFGLPDFVFDRVAKLKGKNLFILLDELEFLNDYQTRRIGALLKYSDETSVIFKIGSRYMPAKVHVGDSDEVLQETDDFKIINITDALNYANSNNRRDYSTLVKNILNRRIMKSSFFQKVGITDAEQLFPGLPIEQEALEIVKGRDKHWNGFKNYLKKTKNREEINDIIAALKHPDNPIIEKLNMLLYYRGKLTVQEIRRMMDEYLQGENLVYRNLYQKNALNLLFQLHSDYRSEKRYCGVDVFAQLSSGIIRNAIEICGQALNTAYNYGFAPNGEKAVGFEYQDIGAKNHAQVKYEDILRIASKVSQEVQEFINQIGTIFRALHSDKYLVEPEQTHFETDYYGIKGKAKEVFDAALQQSYIQRKPAMDPKEIGDARKTDFLLNRVFAPHFEISCRVRGRTYITATQICSLILGSEEEKKKTRKEIVVENSKIRRDSDKQRSLLEVLELNDQEID